MYIGSWEEKIQIGTRNHYGRVLDSGKNSYEPDNRKMKTTTNKEPGTKNGIKNSAMRTQDASSGKSAPPGGKNHYSTSGLVPWAKPAKKTKPQENTMPSGKQVHLAKTPYEVEPKSLKDTKERGITRKKDEW